MFRTCITCIVFGLLMLGGPIVFAQSAELVGSPLQPGVGNETVMSFVWAYAGAALLQWWKKNPRLALMTEDASKWARRRVAIITSILAAIGVHASFDAATGILTISGLLLPGIWQALGDAVRQFTFQQFIYRSAIER
jgi:hypothetical protein